MEKNIQNITQSHFIIIKTIYGSKIRNKKNQDILFSVFHEVRVSYLNEQKRNEKDEIKNEMK